LFVFQRCSRGRARGGAMRSVLGRLLVAGVTVGTALVPSSAGAGAGARAGAAAAGVAAALGDAGGVRAPGCGVRYLVPPNPINQTDGMALDGKGGLYVTQALYNRVLRIDLAHP